MLLYFLGFSDSVRKSACANINELLILCWVDRWQFILCFNVRVCFEMFVCCLIMMRLNVWTQSQMFMLLYYVILNLYVCVPSLPTMFFVMWSDLSYPMYLKICFEQLIFCFQYAKTHLQILMNCWYFVGWEGGSLFCVLMCYFEFVCLPTHPPNDMFLKICCG